MWQIRHILTRFSNCGGVSPIVVGLAGEARPSSRSGRLASLLRHRRESVPASWRRATSTLLGDPTSSMYDIRHLRLRPVRADA